MSLPDRMNPKPPAALELLLPRTIGGETTVQLDAESEVLRLFDEWGPGLRRYIASFGLGVEASDDVLQEAFLSLFRHLCLGRSRSNLTGWLFRVAHNLALKQRQRNRTQQSDVVAADAIADPADNPEQQVAGHQRRQRLRAVVRALPERDRQCLYLRAEGIPYRDIADTLGISLGSVAKSIARALARLSRADIG
jgi:RNA polymerase sigma-70 factor, ECF subfamily